MVIVVMAMDTASGTIIAGPDLVSRGFVYVRDAEELMLEAERRVHQVLDDCEAQRIKDWTTLNKMFAMHWANSSMIKHVVDL